MTTAMLAAVYARHGGGNVLAWDNNDTRGTLGWRTEQGFYDTTIRDLLPAAPHLLAADRGGRRTSPGSCTTSPPTGTTCSAPTPSCSPPISGSPPPSSTC